MYEYIVYLKSVDTSAEIQVGSYTNLSNALSNARCGCQEHGATKWDWVVDKYQDYTLVNRRSSTAGFER